MMVSDYAEGPEGDAGHVPKLRPLFSGDEGISDETSPEKPRAGQLSSSSPSASPCQQGTSQSEPRRDRPNGSEDVPRLAPLEALLPLALERVERLEKIVAGHQLHFNELVPLTRDILNMHSSLQGHHNATVRTCQELREAHEALCEEHDALCASLASAGLVDKERLLARRRCASRPSASAAALEGAVKVLHELVQATWEPRMQESLASAAGPEAWRQLVCSSRSLAFGMPDCQEASFSQAPALVTAPSWTVTSTLHDVYIPQDGRRPEDATGPAYGFNEGQSEQSFFNGMPAAASSAGLQPGQGLHVVQVDLHKLAGENAETADALREAARASPLGRLNTVEGFE